MTLIQGRISVFLFAVCLACGPGARSAAADRPARFVVGVEELDYAPHYTTLSGTYRGFGRAVLDAFAAESGITLEYLPLPVARLHQALVEGRVDLKYPDHPLWGRAVKAGHGIAYSAPVVRYIDGVLIQPALLEKPAAERLYRLATVRGFTLPEGAWPGDRAPAVQEYGSFAAAIRAVLEGNADGLFGNTVVVRHQLRQVMMMPSDAVVFDPALPYQGGTYHVSSRDHGALLGQFDAWAQKSAARIAMIMKDYGVE